MFTCYVRWEDWSHFSHCPCIPPTFPSLIVFRLFVCFLQCLLHWLIPGPFSQMMKWVALFASIANMIAHLVYHDLSGLLWTFLLISSCSSPLHHLLIMQHMISVFQHLIAPSGLPTIWVHGSECYIWLSEPFSFIQQHLPQVRIMFYNTIDIIWLLSLCLNCKLYEGRSISIYVTAVLQGLTVSSVSPNFVRMLSMIRRGWTLRNVIWIKLVSQQLLLTAQIMWSWGGVSRKRQKQSPCDFGSPFLYTYTKNSQSQHDCFSMICVRNCGSSFAYFIWPNSTMTHWVW